MTVIGHFLIGWSVVPHPWSNLLEASFRVKYAGVYHLLLSHERD